MHNCKIFLSLYDAKPIIEKYNAKNNLGWNNSLWVLLYLYTGKIGQKLLDGMSKHNPHFHHNNDFEKDVQMFIFTNGIEDEDVEKRLYN